VARREPVGLGGGAAPPRPRRRAPRGGAVPLREHRRRERGIPRPLPPRRPGCGPPRRPARAAPGAAERRAPRRRRPRRTGAPGPATVTARRRGPHPWLDGVARVGHGGAAAAGMLDLSASLAPLGPSPAALAAARDSDPIRYPAADAAPLVAAAAALLGVGGER